MFVRLFLRKKKSFQKVFFSDAITKNIKTTKCFALLLTKTILPQKLALPQLHVCGSVLLLLNFCLYHSQHQKTWWRSFRHQLPLSDSFPLISTMMIILLVVVVTTPGRTMMRHYLYRLFLIFLLLNKKNNKKPALRKSLVWSRNTTGVPSFLEKALDPQE